MSKREIIKGYDNLKNEMKFWKKVVEQTEKCINAGGSEESCYW